uniref:TNFR-Cys domain-containing protein n=1 Tax=Macrostomum lignano TaxID=282301 RepID=A0A1I8IJJ2_9PLAT
MVFGSKLISALCCCALSLSLALSAIFTCDRQRLISGFTDVARSLVPAWCSCLACDPVTIRPPEACTFSNSNGTAYVCVGLAVILALICQTALCWLSNRDGRSVTNVEIVVEKGQLEQHQQQLDSLKPIAGGRIGAANRKRRPPTSSSAAAAAAKTPSSSAVSSSRAQDTSTGCH